MCSIICVTNRHICYYDYFTQIEKIAAARPDCIIVREKDLIESEYAGLLSRVKNICGKYDVKVAAHSFFNAADELGIKTIHIPLERLAAMSDKEKGRYDMIGTSCHSVNDAIKAKVLGASYIIAGHIFETDCKKGLPGRGVGFLRNVCKNTDIPVYAIGGINDKNIDPVIDAGAKGVCIMSGLMNCPDPQRYIYKLRGGQNENNR